MLLATAVAPLGLWWRKGRHSLKGALLMWLVPGLLVLMGGSLLWFTYSLRSQVDAAYDRALAGALRAINHNISTASGGLGVEQPYLLLEFFELTVNGRVYFRVATEDGLAEIGNPGLPLPGSAFELDVPQFYDAMYLNEPIRVASWHAWRTRRSQEIRTAASLCRWQKICRNAPVWRGAWCCAPSCAMCCWSA